MCLRLDFNQDRGYKKGLFSPHCQFKNITEEDIFSLNPKNDQQFLYYVKDVDVLCGRDICES